MTMFLDAVRVGDLDIFLREFGELVAIGGQPLVALIDDEGQGPDEARENVNVQVRRVVVKESELARPKAARPLMLDGVQWVVSRSESQGGFLEIQLYREVS